VTNPLLSVRLDNAGERLVRAQDLGGADAAGQSVRPIPLRVADPLRTAEPISGIGG
jgi:hypothetical protein